MENTIPRKPVSSTADDPVSAVSPTTGTGTYNSVVSSASNPHSPEDIRAPPSPVTVSSPSRTDAASPEQQFYDAPEVVPGTGPKIITGRPDYDGEKLTLGVNADPSAAPQVMYNTDPASMPQATSTESSPPYSSIDSDPKSGPQAVTPTAFAGIGGAADKEGGAAAATGGKTERPWWKRKLVLTVIALVLFIIIGLAVGLGVGLSIGRDSNDSGNSGGGGGDSGGDDSDDNQGSPDGGGTSISCDGGLCPPILTTAIIGGQLNILARTSSNRLAVRTHDGNRWSSGWTDLGVVPGDGNTLVSQPAAVVWEVDGDDHPRLDVFVVSSDENRVFGKQKVERDGTWSADWVDLGPGAGSAVQVCRGGDDRIYLWTVDDASHNITQNAWVPNPNSEARKKLLRLKPRQLDEDEDEEDEDEEDENEEEESGDGTGGGNGNDSDSPGNWATTGTRWDTASNPAQGPAASAPGVACRASSILHDLVWYDRDADRLWHQSYNDSASSWGTRRSFNGDWVGSPSIFSYTTLSSSSDSRDQQQRFDFFGIQSDGEVYTFSWSAADGYTDVRSLGDTISIISNPTAIIYPASSSSSESSDDSSTRDIFALGSDGRLHHQHHDGTAWARDWENLNVTARSAPEAVVFDSAAWLFWLGEDNRLMAGRMARAANPGAEWANHIEVEDLGGDLTLEYFMADE